MTNREKINELGGVLLEPEGSGSDKYFLMVSEKWLDSEYKEPDHIADTSDMVEPTTKNDCAEQNGCITCSLDDGDDCCRKLYEESMQEPTTKNDLGVDAVSRDEVCRYVAEFVNHEFSTREEEELIDNIITGIEHMPSVTPQEPILDKIKGQIKDYLRGVEITLEVLVENDPLRPKMEGAKDTLEECLELIDKADKEQKDDNN